MYTFVPHFSFFFGCVKRSESKNYEVLYVGGISENKHLIGMLISMLII